MTCKPLDDETRERLQAGWPEEGQATPAHILETQIMHLRIPKNEREWWARREIELLRDKVEALQSCACADCNREILELRAEVEAQRELLGRLVDLWRAGSWNPSAHAAFQEAMQKAALAAGRVE